MEIIHVPFLLINPLYKKQHKSLLEENSYFQKKPNDWRQLPLHSGAAGIFCCYFISWCELTNTPQKPPKLPSALRRALVCLFWRLAVGSKRTQVQWHPTLGTNVHQQDKNLGSFPAQTTLRKQMPNFSSVQPAPSKLSHHLDQALDQTDDFSATFSFSCYCQINIGQRFVCRRFFPGLATDVSISTAKTQFLPSPRLQTQPFIMLRFRFCAGSTSVC